MTREFENMLYLFGASATGREIKTEYCENLSKIRQLAVSQGIWDIIYAGIREKIESGDVKIPPEIYAQLEKTFMSNVALNIQRVEFNLNTLRCLEENGIKCCVLKGITVARFYNMPEARISSDMDILIEIKDEDRVVQLLTTLGYKCEKRAKYDHHMKAVHDVGGLLEVHVALHSVATSDIILDDEVHYNEEFRLTDEGVYTLGINDTLIYLSAHLIKHLINDATGVRQMMDLLLYMKAYEKEINWEGFNALIEKLGYNNLIAVVKGIGVRFFGMKFEGTITEGNGLEELLEDCETGGLFGKKESERKGFFQIYTQQRSGKNNISDSIYRLTKSENGIFRMIFPECSDMKKHFIYVEKFPMLLPIGWIHRIIVLTLKQMGIIKKNNMDSHSNQRRMEMVKKLGMIKNGENK